MARSCRCGLRPCRPARSACGRWAPGAAHGRFCRCPASELARRAAVRGSEEAAEVLRAGEAPATRDRQDRLVPEGRIDEVVATALEPRCPYPLADARAFGGEELVQVPRRDERRLGDVVGIEERIADVGLDERFDVEEDFRPRPARGVACGSIRVEAAREVEDALGRPRSVFSRSRCPLPAGARRVPRYVAIALGCRSLPGRFTAVSLAICSACRPSSSRGMRTTSVSNGWSACRTTGCDVS